MQTIIRHLNVATALTIAAVASVTTARAQQATRMSDAINELGRKPIVTAQSEGPDLSGATEEKELQRLMAIAPTRIPVQQGNLATAIEVTASAASMNFIAPPAGDFPEIITISVNMNPYRLLLQLADQYRFTMRYQDGVWRFSREAVGALVARTYKLKHTNLDSFTAKQNTIQSVGDSSSSGNGGGGDSSGSGGSSSQGGGGLGSSNGHVFTIDTKKIVEDIKNLIGLPSTSTRVVVTSSDQLMPEDDGKRPVLSSSKESVVKDNGTRVIYLPNTTSLYVVATRAQQDHVAAFLKEVDVVEPQVRIVTRFVQTMRNPSEILGVSSSIARQSGENDAHLSISGAGGVFAFNKIGGRNLINATDLNLQLNALAQESDAKLINNPDVTTTNNREVYLSVGTEEPFLESNTTNIGAGLGSAQAKISYRRIGTTINVNPTIFTDDAGKDTVRLFVQVEVAKLTGFRNINGVDVPIVASEKYLYTVFVPSGYTLAFGGFSGLEETETVKGVPGISKVPVLGWMFKNRNRTKTQKNLVAYITPSIMRPEDYQPAMAATPRPVE